MIYRSEAKTNYILTNINITDSKTHVKLYRTVKVQQFNNIFIIYNIKYGIKNIK